MNYNLLSFNSNGDVSNNSTKETKIRHFKYNIHESCMALLLLVAITRHVCIYEIIL